LLHSPIDRDFQRFSTFAKIILATIISLIFKEIKIKIE
jgi:hypothetical protein